MRKLIIAILSAAAAVAGCGKLEYSYPGNDNKLFILSDNMVEQHLVRLSDSTLSATLSLGIAQPQDEDIRVKMAVAPELFEKYTDVYHDEDILLMPSENCEVVTGELVIPAGNVKSIPVQLAFSGLDTLDMDLRYVVPVTVRSAEGIDILESARTKYFVFKGASLINVVADLNENRAWPEWRNPEPFKSMYGFTLEALVYPNELSKQISTIMGIENVFLVRVGDSGIASNQLQVATSAGNVTSTSLQLQTGKWTHIAVVYDYGDVKVYIDGERKISKSIYLRNGINFGVEHSDESDGKPRCFWIGYSYDDNRCFNGRFSEVRIWSRALSENDINAENHFYTVDPSASGLQAYWKFDEGAGNRIKDWTANGNDLTAESAPDWISVSLPARNKE